MLERIESGYSAKKICAKKKQMLLGESRRKGMCKQMEMLSSRLAGMLR